MTLYADMTEKQKKYDQDWKAKNTTRVTVRLNNNTDADIIEYLSTLDSKQGYIKELIREDMKKQNR